MSRAYAMIVRPLQYILYSVFCKAVRASVIGLTPEGQSVLWYFESHSESLLKVAINKIRTDHI